MRRLTIEVLGKLIHEYHGAQDTVSQDSPEMELIEAIFNGLDNWDPKSCVPEKQRRHIKFIIANSPNPTTKTKIILNKLNAIFQSEEVALPSNTQTDGAVSSTTSATLEASSSTSSSDSSKAFTKQKVSFFKKALSSLSLLYNDGMSTLGGWPEHSHVMTGIFLGQIPHVTTSDCTTREVIKISDFVDSINSNRPLRLVLSVCEETEVNGSAFMFSNTVKPQEWINAGIKHQLLNMRDFTANVSTDDCIAALQSVEDCLKEGGSVLVHCKAGRARSGMFLAIFMALNVNNPKTGRKYTIPEAIEALVHVRPQVEVHKGKSDTAKATVSLLSQSKAGNYADLISPLERLLSSKELKDAILYPTADKRTTNDDAKVISRLLEYRTKCAGKKRAGHIEDIIRLINKPHSEEWYTRLMQETGCVKRFLEAHPVVSEIGQENQQRDRNTRRELIDTLVRFVKAEITLLLEKYCITPQDFENYFNEEIVSTSVGNYIS